MFFKRIFFVLICLTTSACVEVGEKPPSKHTFEVKPSAGSGVDSGSAGCLDNFDSFSRDYFNGRSTEKAINDFFSCSINALDLFRRRVVGQTPGLYSPEELRTFIHSFFLKKKKISDVLLYEAMVFKSMVVGGDEKALAAGEIERTLELLKVLQQQALILLPWMPIDYDHFNGVSLSQLEEGLAQLERVGDTLSAYLVHSQRPYLASHITRFLSELQALIEKDKEGLWPRRFRDNLEIYGALKTIMMGGAADEVRPDEWQHLARQGTRWLSMNLRWENLKARRHTDWRKEDGKKNLDWFYGDGLAAVTRTMVILKQLVEEAFRSRPEHLIPFEDFDRFFDAKTEPTRSQWVKFNRLAHWKTLAANKVIAEKDVPDRIDRDLVHHLKDSLRPLVRSVLGGPDRGSVGRDAAGLTAGLIDRVWDAFARWQTQQKYIEKIYLAQGGIPAILGKGFPKENLLAVPPSEKAEFTSFEVTRVATEEVREIISRFRPYFPDGESRVFFPSSPADEHSILNSFHNVSRLNWIRSFERFLIRGYSKDWQRAHEYGGVTESELDEFYWDFYDYGIKMGLLDPTVTLAALRRFREANLFTRYAKWDGLLTLDEGTELFAYLLSANEISKRIHDDLAKACDGPLDRNKRRLIEPKCYRAEFIKRFPQYWGSQPELVRFYTQVLDDRGREAFVDALESALHKDGYPKGMPFDKFETDTMVMILHYVESIFYIYDADRSGTLSRVEAESGIDVFRGVILELGGSAIKNEDDLHAVFTYLLREGEPPSSAHPIRWFVWKQTDRKNRNFEADRLQMLKIFSALAK